MPLSPQSAWTGLNLLPCSNSFADFYYKYHRRERPALDVLRWCDPGFEVWDVAYRGGSQLSLNDTGASATGTEECRQCRAGSFSPLGFPCQPCMQVNLLVGDRCGMSVNLQCGFISCVFVMPGRLVRVSRDREYRQAWRPRAHRSRVRLHI